MDRLPSNRIVRDALLDAMAAANHGLVRWSDAVLFGMHPDDLRCVLRRDRWHRVQRGVHVRRGTELTAAVRARAATISPAMYSAVVASHQTAARLHGLPLVHHGDREHVTVRRPARRPQRPELWLHAHRLPAEHVTQIGGTPCTTIARTLVDLFLVSDRLTATWATEYAVRTGLVTLDEVRALASTPLGLPGIRRTRTWLDTVEPASESPLETAVRLILVDADLPRPVVQLPIRAGSGRVVYRTDLGFGPERVAVEADGRAVHEAPEAVLRDRLRQNDLTSAGWIVLRFTWADATRRPGYVAATVRRALNRRHSETRREK
ncbi:MAG TPA: DUF559 domain-containing protein [Mycobacteriales bacterium]|jgi:Protein of unknown function (DUF559).